jgi:hypothetical protein
LLRCGQSGRVVNYPTGAFWAHLEGAKEPESSRAGVDEAPILTLLKHLEEAFPTCKDQTKHEGVFTPRRGVHPSYFVYLDNNLTSKQQQIQQDYAQLQDGSLHIAVQSGSYLFALATRRRVAGLEIGRDWFGRRKHRGTHPEPATIPRHAHFRRPVGPRRAHKVES